MLLQFWDLGRAWLHDWVAYLVWEHSHIRHPVDCSLDKWEERECCLWFSLYCTVAQVCSRGSDLWDKPSHINSCMEQQLRLRGQKWQSYCLSRGYRYRLPACSVARLCPILWDPMDCCPPDSSVHGISSKNTGAGCQFLLPGPVPDNQFLKLEICIFWPPLSTSIILQALPLIITNLISFSMRFCFWF